MNRGNIPGFYYDEDKKKYFKITADHKVPAGAKHSRSNVKHEKQQAKKRKLDQRAERKLRAQTIKRPSILTLPQYGGIGLGRELGISSSHAASNVQADAAYASQLQLHKARVQGNEDSGENNVNVLSAIGIPNRDRTLVTVHWPDGFQGGSGTFMFPRDFSRLSDQTWRDEELKWAKYSINRIMAFKAPVTSTAIWPREDPQIILQVANCFGYSCYIGHVTDDDPYGVSYNVDDDNETTLWDTAIDPTGTKAAVAAGATIDVNAIGDYLSPSTQSFSGRHETTDCRALDWLTPDILLAGDQKSVVLWDVRTDSRVHKKGGAVAHRFLNESVVTGLQVVPSSGGNQVLTSTNNHLNLYDLRMPSTHKDRTLLSIPNVSEVPKLNFDISNRGIVATSTKRGPSTELRLVNLKTGQELRTLQSPKVSPSQPSQIMWLPDERGVDYLSICSGSWVYKWTWQELDGETDEE